MLLTAGTKSEFDDSRCDQYIEEGAINSTMARLWCELLMNSSVVPLHSKNF